MYNDSSSAGSKDILSLMRVQPLPVRTILEFAAKQGWLIREWRFLAAYALLGGNPRRWRLMEEAHQQGLIAEPSDGSDDEWRCNLISWLANLLASDTGERYFDKALLDLSDDAMLVLNHLVENPRGVVWDDLLNLFADEADTTSAAERRTEESLHILDSELGIVEKVGFPRSIIEQSVEKFQITDTVALFEKLVFPNCVDSGGQLLNPLPDVVISKMKIIERLALVNLTKGSVDHVPQFDNVFQNVQLVNPDGKNVELDVIAEISPSKPFKERGMLLLICECTVDEHKPMASFENAAGYLQIRKATYGSCDESMIARLLVIPYWGSVKMRLKGFNGVDFKNYISIDRAKWAPWPKVLSN